MSPRTTREIAEDMRKTATALRAYLDEALQGSHSLLAEILVRFPFMIEDLARELHETEPLPAKPTWPDADAPAEEHFNTLMQRQAWIEALRAESRNRHGQGRG